jgi:hypothetical protein
LVAWLGAITNVERSAKFFHQSNRDPFMYARERRGRARPGEVRFAIG